MSGWVVDVNARKIQHKNGLTIVFEGQPDTDHFAGSLSNYPKHLTPLQIARLIREGFDEFRAAWKEASNSQPILRLKQL